VFHQVSDMLIFAAVARAGSLTRAGKTLGLPKSTISRRLSELEERIGSRLLIKSTRKLVLTEAGEAFLERCQRLSDDVDDALAFASELADQPRGTLRMTMPPDLGPLLLADAIASFTARYPQLIIELDESARYVDLGTERYDLALRAGSLADSSLVARPILRMSSGLFASPGYLAQKPAPKTPAALADHRFIVLAGRTRFDHATLQAGARSVNVALPGVITATTSGMQRALALADVGAIMYPERLCRDDVRAGRLVRLLPDYQTAPSPLWLVTPSRRLLPRKTVLFIEHLTAHLADACANETER
jgi:DNA-binding transcriptional LysR family regulator